MKWQNSDDLFHTHFFGNHLGTRAKSSSADRPYLKFPCFLWMKIKLNKFIYIYIKYTSSHVCRSLALEGNANFSCRVRRASVIIWPVLTYEQRAGKESMAGVSRIHHLILVFLWHFVEDFSSLGFLTIFTVLFNIQLVSLQPEVHLIEGAFLAFASWWKHNAGPADAHVGGKVDGNLLGFDRLRRNTWVQEHPLVIDNITNVVLLSYQSTKCLTWIILVFVLPLNPSLPTLQQTKDSKIYMNYEQD